MSKVPATDSLLLPIDAFSTDVATVGKLLTTTFNGKYTAAAPVIPCPGHAAPGHLHS
jgi:hypothetical protein